MIYDLKSFKKASIMKYDESKRLGITNTSYPSTYGDLSVEILFTVSVISFTVVSFIIYTSFLIFRITRPCGLPNVRTELSIDYSYGSCKE